MNWFWLNMPLAALIVAAVAGIPLWMVIKHPDTEPDAAAAKPLPGWESVRIISARRQAGRRGIAVRSAASDGSRFHTGATG